tara:strand:+ start:3165 stop:3305 length:141 start_codon:yes stop_codon:yes gene_type:complete
MSEKYYDPSGKDITDEVNKSLGKKKPKTRRIPVIPYDPKTEANDNG